MGGWFGAVHHGAVAVILAWAAAGVLQPVAMGEAGRAAALPASGSGAREVPGGTRGAGGAPGGAASAGLPLVLGAVEVATVLALLDALFLAFLLVQFRYFFGGAAWEHAPGGPTYAEYAHRGFFELVAVVALMLPVLLGACWLAAVLAWLAVTVLRGRGERFATGAVVAVLVGLMALHALNPAAVVAQANLRHYRATGRFDAAYAASLGAGAVPALLAGLAGLPPDAQQVLAEALLSRWGSPPPGDWRSWNWDEARARRLVDAQRQALAQAAGGRR